MNKKAVVSTFCTWTSFGSVLQSYSFHLFLKNIGVLSSIIINKAQKQYVLPDYVIRKQNAIKGILFYFVNLFYERKRKIRFNKVQTFIDKNLPIEYFDNYSSLIGKKMEADVFISGSDQVFQPSICDPALFLDFVTNDKIKISYAASLGSLVIPEEKKNTFIRMINNFDFLSLREKDAADFVSTFYKKKITVNSDPTFLVKKEIWDNLSNEHKIPKIHKKYYLVYAIYWDKKYNKFNN